MSNFVKFIKDEHIIKLGVSFMIGYSTQNLFQSLIEHFTKNVNQDKKTNPVLVNFFTLVFVLVFSYFLTKFQSR